MKRIFRVLSILVMVFFAFASCSLFGPTSKTLSMYVTGTPGNYTIARSVTARSTTGTAGVTTELGGNKIVVTKVEMVFLGLKLDVDSDNPDSLVEDLEVGPYLFELPLDGSAANLFNGIVVPEGIYDQLEIEVDAPEGDVEHESLFTQTYPEWPITASIRVTGTHQVGSETPVPFIYLQSAFSADFAMDFIPPLAIDSGTTIIVLAVDVSTWFLNTTKDGLLNPSSITAGSSEADRVGQNIEASFEAFEESLES